MERYFPLRRTDLVPFPLKLKDHGKVAVSSTVSCFLEINFTHTKFFLNIYLTDSPFSRDESNLRTFLVGKYAWEVCKQSELNLRKFGTTSPQFSRKSSQIRTWRIGNQEQARTMAHYFASSVVSTRKARCHLVLKAELFTAKGTGTDSYRVEMQNGTGNFRNFQISRKKDYLER